MTAAPRLALLAGLLVLLTFAGCGRAMPEDEPVPEGGDTTGAFGDPGGLEGRIRTAAVPLGSRFAEAAAAEFKVEEPSTKVAFSATAAEDALQRLCAGSVELAAVDRPLAASERSSCEGPKAGGAVELLVARRGGTPVYLVTTQEALVRSFDTETFLDFVITNDEAVAKRAGLEPLSVDELQESQTRLEQALAGI